MNLLPISRPPLTLKTTIPPPLPFRYLCVCMCACVRACVRDGLAIAHVDWWVIAHVCLLADT